MERELEREEAMVSSPEISRCSVCSSVVSALPRRELRDLLQNDCAGAVLSLRSSISRRVRFSCSMSFVASSPTCLRLISLSETRGAFGPNICHILLTLAKPERRAMKETPVIPSRSRQAVKRLFRSVSVSFTVVLCGSSDPIVQKPTRKTA